MQSLVEIGPVVYEKKIFKFRYHLPLERNVAFHFNKLECFSNTDAFVPSFFEV